MVVPVTVWTKDQFIAISIIPRVTGFFSIVGSSAIIYMILSDIEKKLVKSYHRLMLVMSFFDFLQSIALATSTSAFPKESLVYGSIGNMATCRAQNIILTLGLAVPLYNASLSVYYLLTIRYRFPSRYFATKIEPFLHAASILIPTSFAIWTSVTQDLCSELYSPVCAISRDTSIIWTIVSVAVLCACVCLYSMVSISCYANKRSIRVRRYSHSENQRQRQESDKQATIRQAMFYSLAFAITFVPAGLRIICPYYTIEVLKNIFYPLQGFWNFVLYVRPIVVKKRETTPDKYLYEIVWSAVFHRNERNDEVNERQSNDMIKNSMQAMARLINLEEISKSSVGSKEDSQIDTRTLDAGIIANSEESKHESCKGSPERLAVGLPSLSITSEERGILANVDESVDVRMNESFIEPKQIVSSRTQTNSKLRISP